MVMVAVGAKVALWGANASLLQPPGVDMYHGPTVIEVTLNFRGSANKDPAKSARNQCSDLYGCTATVVLYLSSSMQMVAVGNSCLLRDHLTNE